MRLENKVALITGAGTGIGRESRAPVCSRGCVGRRASTSTRPRSRPSPPRSGPRRTGSRGHRRCVRRRTRCRAHGRRGRGRFGRPRRAVQQRRDHACRRRRCQSHRRGRLGPHDGGQRQGRLLGCKYGIPALLRAGGGSIINTASFVALVGAATPQIAYTASKGAVLALTRELAVVHARQKASGSTRCVPGRCAPSCS